MLNYPVQIEAVSHGSVRKRNNKVYAFQQSFREPLKAAARSGLGNMVACTNGFSLQGRNTCGDKLWIHKLGATQHCGVSVRQHSYHRVQSNSHKASTAMQQMYLHNATPSHSLGGEWVQRQRPPVMLSKVGTCIAPSKEEGRYCNTKMSSFAHKLTVEVYLPQQTAAPSRKQGHSSGLSVITPSRSSSNINATSLLGDCAEQLLCR